jgi:DNA helicase-2/ATP-dependent DNA helicase PcrA
MRGPAVLGRSVVVAPGRQPPPEWDGCRRAEGSTEELEQAWRDRTPLVIEVDDGPGVGEATGKETSGNETAGSEPASGPAGGDEVERAPVWSLAPSFSFPGERRAHATFANSVDARGARAKWHLADRAVRLGGRAVGPADGVLADGVLADVVLADGTPAFCDGGPLEWQGPIGQVTVVPRLALMAGSLVPFGANTTDAALAPDQLEAVLHPGGAARIIAPAGSGKTRVLTERARHLLRKWRLPGRAVTLVAYNKRAADEIRERTPDLPDLQVRTLNSLGLSILTRSVPVTTIDESEVRRILDGLVDLPHRANTDPAVAWIEALSAVRLGLQAPAEVEAEFGGDVDGLAEVFDRYRRLLADRRLVDFDEQVYRAIEVLLTDPGARRAARSSCRALLVDEFQDLTPAHLLLVRLLAGPEGAVFGVGDDDQTIYGYSGASPEWLIDFRRFFPTAGEHPLHVNYRCPVSVVDAARTLLTHNQRRVQKRIVAAPGRARQEGELEVIASQSPLTATVDRVAGLVADGAAPGEVAVLTRVNASLAPVQVGLVHRGVPVRPAVDASYLSRGAVQAALAWLRLAVSSPEHLAGADVALAARRPSRALSPRVVEWMSEQSGVGRLERLAGRLNARDADKITGFVSDLKVLHRKATAGTTVTVLRAVRDDIGLDRAMELLEGSRRRLDRSAQTDDLDALVALAALHAEPQGFEDWLSRSLRHPGAVDGVVLSTVHRVKGREWPHVVLHEVSAGLLPHRLAVDVEEERRVFHVGLTRGSVSVYVVGGEVPSPFLAQLDEEWTETRRPVGPAPPRTAPALARAEALSSLPARRQVVPAGGGPSRSARAPRGEPVPPEVVERARQALRAWRSQRASTEHKPPYIYLHDRTLEALASEAPSTMAALARVSGIGPGKVESYGDELLALIAAARRG